MAGGFFFDEVWLDGARFGVAGSALVAEVGWVGSFSCREEGIESKVEALESRTSPVPLVLKPVGSGLLLYGEASVRRGAQGAFGVTTAVLTGSPGTQLGTNPPA